MRPEGQAGVSSLRSRNARRSFAFLFSPLDLPPIPVTLSPPQGLRFKLSQQVRFAMTKQKTHKSTKKRFRLTATGKVKHRKCGTSHLAISKPAKKIRQLRGTRVLEPSMTRAIVDALRGNSY